MMVRTAHRVAAVLSVLFLILAIVLAGRYLRQYGGWGFGAGNNDLMNVALAVLGFVLAGSFALLRPGGRNVRGARLTSVAWSLALLGGLLFTWWVISVSPRWVDDVGTSITSPESLDEFASAHPETFLRYSYEVPTGVFLQSFEFLSANNVQMAGYVWQYYSNDIPDDIARGIVLPEAVEEAYEATEAWRIPDEDGVLYGWYFSGTFRQNFDYRLFPFDRQNIWLRLWHPNPDRPVLLVPDFASYSDLAPESLPGIERDFVYGGWDPLRSGFSFNLIGYNTHFGLGGLLNGIPYADLYFNLAVERDSLGPLLEHIVLEAAIAILLFFLLLLMANESAVHERVGLTIFDLIVASGGLLFAVILDHNSIRTAVTSQALTYLEWFPLVLEVFIVMVVLSAVLRVQNWRLPVVGYTGNLVPVLAYWPALLGTVLAVTLLVFFY